MVLGRPPKVVLVILPERFIIFYLPVYSPRSNSIKTLWRKMKYKLLKPEVYDSFEKLAEAVKEIFIQTGKEYRIKFKDKVFMNQFVRIIT